MKIISGQKVSLPVWVILTFIVLLGIIAYVAFDLLGSSPEGFIKTTSGVGKELVQTLFVGVLIGTIVDLYVHHILKSSPLEMLERSGIRKIYPARQDAINALRELIKNEKTISIYISGISLRDFWTPHGNMHEVWKDICARLEGNKSKSTGPRLCVRLLLLDPRSSEGYFRYRVERPDAPEEMGDIKEALIEIARLQKKVGSDFLQVRLYDHCPFSFNFLTDDVVFTEQYYYGEHNKEVSLPLIEYPKSSSHQYRELQSSSHQYRELQRSLEIIWEHAHGNRINVGTAIPLEKSRIKNIFRVDNKPEQSKRQADCIRSTSTGTVDILTITGRYYVDNYIDTDKPASEALLEISSPKRGKNSILIRFALINPVSQQAIYRAVADGVTVEKIRETLEKYSWEDHKLSNLYANVWNTIRQILRAKSDGHSLDLRFYSCSTASSLLITPESVIVGKYIYGRSKRLQEKRTLKSEYPAFEIEVPKLETEDCIELEILKCTFDIIWNDYSISYEEYKKRSEEDEFNKNLERLKEELGLIPMVAGGNS